MTAGRHGLHAALAALCLAGAAAWGHGSADHGQDDALPDTEAPQGAAATDTGGAPAVTPLPWDVGGPFTLTDHTGSPRSQVDPDGQHQLLFLGYANCPGICSAALPMMAQAAALLRARGMPVSPVLITIDPARDTVQTMGPALARHAADFVGLTGTPAQLARAHDAFRISFEKVMDHPEHGPIYAHGSHIYLLGPEGDVLTLLPPVLPAEQVAGIVAKYVEG